MSRENVKKFYELAEIDKEFAQKLARLDSEMSLEASDLANLKDIVNEKIIPLAKKKGLEFTAEEMVDFANEKYLQLSEDDLLDVSGGVEPKKAAWGLSTVLMFSLASAAAINLMNNNHDDVSHVVSEPSKTASEEKDESEDEEALKKSLDEMMKKSPKGADKNANMEDIEKELDKLFKGGKLGGGSAFRPGKGRTAGKNMLNRTIGKKGTSDFDFDKFLKELDDELAKEAATSQAAKPKATTSETSNFDFDKFMEEINSEKKSETAATRAATSDAAPLEEEAKPAQTATSARIEETTKRVPTSRGTPKKIEKTKEQVEAEKKQAQQQVDKRLEAFKVKFENSFKEKFKTQCDDEDLKAFVQEYLATPGNLDGAMVSGETTVKFYQGYVFSKGSATASTDLLAFAKELNETLPKATYKAQYSIFNSWKNIMSPVMEALRNVKYDINKFDDVSRDNMIGDINNIYNKIHELGYLPGHSEYGRSPESNERKTLEVLRALKESNYNKNDEKVQAALKALSGGEIKEDTVKKPDASGEDQERIEREKKAEEERLMKEKEKEERIEREKKDEMARSMGGVDEEDDFINTGRIDISDAQSTETAENYKPVRKSDSWKNIMAHVMEALNKVGFDINKLNSAEQINLKNDINWICSEMKQANGTYYLGASALLGGAVRSNYGWNTKNPSHENKELEFLQSLKTANYNVAAEKVQSALKELSSDELNDENKEQNISSGTEDKKVHLFESQEAAQKIVDALADTLKLTVEEKFNSKTQLSEGDLQQFVSERISEAKAMQETAIVGSNTVTFFAKGQREDGTAVEASETVNVFELAKELNEKLPKAGVEDAKKDETEKPQEELKEKPVVKSDAGTTVTTAKELQQQAEQQVGLARTELYKKFQTKIKANNDIELNEANLNKLINETLENYKKESKENITVNEKNGTITFTVKGTIPGAIWGTKDGVSSATLNVRDFFTKLNNEASEGRRKSERSSFVHTQYVTATESDVTGGLKLARETAKEMIREKFEDIIVAKYNAENPAKKATSVVDIPAVKRATIVKSLNLNEVISKIVKANLKRTHDFKDPDKENYEGSYSIKTAPENEELKIGAIGYKKTGLFGTSTELIKYGDEISIREEVEKLIEKTTVAYKSVIGGRAGAESEALYKFLTDNKLVENGTVVESVLDTIKDSDKEQFKKDVKHIADQISGSEGKYTLSGKWRSYNVAQEKLKAIKKLAKQLDG